MTELRIPSSYRPLPRQAAFHASPATAKGYGGAMGGGKTRALCEEAFQAALTHPGIEVVVARQAHTSITKTTRKSFFREVLPPALAKHCRIIQSGGHDFVEFPNGAVIHFAGLDDPVKWHSAEIGLLVLDEAHEIDEDTVMTLNSRLRQKCADCLSSGARGCTHLPHQILCGFNPENPGHWLYRWFILDADPNEFGFYKAELRLEEESEPIGDALFVQAKATANPYLPDTYIRQRLAGMKEFYRKRYLDGEWLFVSGNCFFDEQRLTEYANSGSEVLYRFDFDTIGYGNKAERKETDLGRIRVYREPSVEGAYAIGADVATGRGLDYSCAYVVDLHNMALVAEFHAKIDADLFAEQLHFLGRWYKTALIAVESAGGFGEPVIISLRDGKHGRPAYPKLYRHKLDANVDLSTVKRFGYPMTSKTRPQVLNQLEKAIRDHDLPWMPSHLIQECHTFCEFEEGTPSPRAQSGCHDDAVMACAITLEMYRQKGHHPDREKRISARRAGRVRKRLTMYPWERDRWQKV